MRKIKIGFYSHGVDYAGTWRGHENVLLNIDRSLFDVYLIHWEEDPDKSRLNYLKTRYSSYINFIPFSRSKKKTGSFRGYTPKKNNFFKVVSSLNLDILHFVRSGYYEWPFTKRICPLQIETNMFGFKDRSKFCDKSIAVSNLIIKRGIEAKVLYIPVTPPMKCNLDLRADLNIPETAVVFGRLGRPELDSSLAIKAFSYINDYLLEDCYLINLGANETRKEGNVFYLQATHDDKYINKFYNTMDIMLHARKDGETFGCTIVEAMMHGIPVVSHYGSNDNAHIEILGEGGVVAKNEKEYIDLAISYASDKTLRMKTGKKGIKQASKFLVKNVVPNYQDFYLRSFEQLKRKRVIGK